MALDLSDLALSVVILGLTTAIGVTVIVNVRDSQLTNISPVYVNNETITGSNTTAKTLVRPLMTSVTCVNNATGVSGAVDSAGLVCINSANYTTIASSSVDGTNTFKLTANSLFNAKSINVTYTSYDEKDPRFTLPDDAAVGIAEYGNWYKTIVIVGVAAVILGLIFMAFGRGARSVESTPAY